MNDTAIFDALTVYIDGKPHLAAKAVKAELERAQAEVDRLRARCERQAKWKRIAEEHMSQATLAYLARRCEETT